MLDGEIGLDDIRVAGFPDPAGQVPALTGPGLDRAVWRPRIERGPRWSLSDLLGLAGGRSELVVVSAHPDDESIGAGRLISAWCHGVGRAWSVLATAGEACLDAVAERSPRLGDRRVQEWNRALDVLGALPLSSYGLRDGRLRDVEADLCSALLGTVGRLARKGVARDEVLLLAPHPADPHPDHGAAGRASGWTAARLGVPVWFYPVWLTYWADPATDLGGELGTVDLTEQHDRAWGSAVECYRSQLRELVRGAGPVVTPEMLDHHDRQLLVVPDGVRS